MSPGLKSFLQRWLVTTAAVLVASNVVTGIRADSILAMFAASLVLGILNAVLRPIMLLLILPLVLVTLGLVTLFVNALLLLLVGKLVHSFHVDGFWAAFKGALVISLISLIANSMIGKEPPAARPRRKKRKEDTGPVIDV